MANVGSGAVGQTLIGNGNGAGPRYAAIGTNSGLTTNGPILGQGNGAFTAVVPANNSVLLTNGSGVSSFSTVLNNSFSYTTATAGGTTNVLVSNTDNTNALSEAIVRISTGGTSAGDPYNRYIIGTTRSFAEGIDNSDAQSFVLTTISTQLASPSNGVLLERTTTAGNKTLPLNSSTSPFLNATIANATGDGTLVSPVKFDSVFFDQNGNYSTSTGLFTAPVTGKYLITASLTLNNLSSSHSLCELRIVAAGLVYTNFFNAGALRDSNNVCTIAITRLVSITAASTAQIDLVVSGGTKTVGIASIAFTSATGLGINLLN
jgi:hypothetical protein